MAKPSASSTPTKRSFQNPKGTRDLYPEDQLRQQYITDAWRRVALRHGFEEIDGPAFEHLDLYTVKSGEGIVSELFSFQRQGGDDTYALRPEFTPTLARMYAARAKQLPVPVRWFSVCNYFRAERPQRGRLREFLQWNVDVIGDASPESDSDLVGVCQSLLNELGFGISDAKIRLSDRIIMQIVLGELGVPQSDQDPIFGLLDRRERIDQEEFALQASDLGLTRDAIKFLDQLIDGVRAHGWSQVLNEYFFGDSAFADAERGHRFFDMLELLRDLDDWWQVDLSIVRGLAYYTGTVFEAIAEGERAVAGGGRYDNLIELMGGPPTPAAGFAMGDVVLGNILDDKGLIPEGKDLLEAVSRPMPARPDVFVASLNEEADGAIVPLVSSLRRGVETDDAPERKPWDDSRYAIPPLHARRSYKSTRKVKKLMQEASAQHARFCVILESEETCTIKDLDAQQQTDKPIPIERAGPIVAGFEAIK